MPDDLRGLPRSEPERMECGCPVGRRHSKSMCNLALPSEPERPMPTDPYKCPCSECVAQRIRSAPERYEVSRGVAEKVGAVPRRDENHDPGDEDVTR